MKALRRASARTNVSIGGRRPAARQRRGIVLLVVISLLALFILMGITFALVSQGYRDASKLELMDQRVGDPPETEMDLILGQILYDSAARTSLQYHSLLRDLYGYDDDFSTQKFINLGATLLEGRDTIHGRITRLMPNPFSGGGQLYTFEIEAIPPTDPTTKNPTALSPIPNYYAGRVLTFRTGTAANHSTRVVATEWTRPNPSLPAKTYVTIESIESKLAGPVTDRLLVGNEFIINGAPFNGSGAGLLYEGSGSLNPPEIALKYQPNSQPGNFPSPRVGAGAGLPSDILDVAILPNYAAYAHQQFGAVLPDGRLPIDLGGLDETWDAPDLQNMFLAMVPPRVATNAALPIIPSFHRPELVHFIRARYFSNAGSAYSLNTGLTPTQFSQPSYQLQRDLLRTMVFRPMPWDHPNFSGSNVNFSSGLNIGDLLTNLTGRDSAGNNRHTWDVDNDGDGIPDSVWIDPGLPVITTKDGRRYKRLAAILIKDLDGSINLNAHGNLKQLENDNYRAATQLPAPPPAAPSFHNGSSYTPPSGTPTNALGLAQTGAFAARGIGFGPAEVSFSNVFTDPLVYNSLLRTRYLSNSETVLNAVPGYRNTAPGRDPLATIKHYGIPSDYANITGGANPLFTPSWFFSPPDTFGVSTIALDVGGQPIWANAGLIDEMRESPYEMALSGETNNADTPYTAAELEALLRYHDPDASQLPDRLLYAARQNLNFPPSTSNPSAFATDNRGSIGPSQLLRNIVSTHSSSIPTPSLTIPSELRKLLADQTAIAPAGLKLPGNATILDLYAYKLQAGGCPPNLIVDQMHKVVPWEFFKGQKFDINRWLGNGIHEDGNPAVDNILEASAEIAWPGSPVATNLPASFQVGSGRVWAQHTNSVPYLNPGNTYQDDNYFARQLYARHLFCLAMALLPDSFLPNCAQEDTQTLPGYPTENMLTTTQYRRLMIRRLAQWAVNCVDYRDQDSTMTAFEFDYNPWDGWQVDGVVTSDGVTVQENLPAGLPQPDMSSAATLQRDIVWGMEYPDLLITETLALHDRRVKDTRYDSTQRDRAGTPPDDDVDQFRIPQGSLFVELYCPNSRNWPTQQRNQKKLLARELYDNNDRLILGAIPGNNHAAWRLAISKLYRSDSTTDTTHKRSPEYMLFPTDPTDFSFLESASFDPIDASLITGTSSEGPLPIDRYAYFGAVNTVPTAVDRSFYGSIANPTLGPGQYAVVGPRATTYLGSETIVNPLSPPLWTNNSPQQIRLGGAPGVAVNDLNGPSSRNPPTIQQPLGIICEIQGVTPSSIVGGVPSPWSRPSPWNIGLNATEPLPAALAPPSNYYPEPQPPGGALLNDAYDDPAAPTNTFINIPVEHPTSNPPYAGNAGRPIADLEMTKSGTYNNCATVFLQRLADPANPYNDVTNPYITVDWATIDVTVFSGEEDIARPVGTPVQPGVEVDPEDSPPVGPFRLRTRQRGFSDTAQPETLYNLWSPVTQNNGTTAPAGGNYYFNVNLSNDLTPPYDPQVDRHTLGYLNGTIDEIMSTPFAGEPEHPLPWLAWNNRPYSNAMELLNVPASSASRATFELTPGYMSYHVAAGPYPDTSNIQIAGFRSPSANLLNFFHVDSSNRVEEMKLCRLLDFVEVPSPYAGAERWYNAKVNPLAQSFGEYISGQFTGVTPPGFSRPIYYRPPFNKLSRFRDPGKININTIFDGEVWNAALGQFPTIGDANYFNQVVAVSRKGTAGAWYAMDPSLPTRFANPFRTADSSDLMPTDFRKEPAEATFLRPDPLSGVLPATRPLFHINQNNPVTGPQYSQWTSLGGGGAFRDIERNPYFRHQALQKMGNTFTTQSNCFAVWITIGYFEVEDVVLPGSTGPRYWTTMRPDEKAAWPDGLMLGQEVGADSGEINRHRAFYMIDRSIPVGFIPGSKLNTDDCVLVRRLIE